MTVFYRKRLYIKKSVLTGLEQVFLQLNVFFTIFMSLLTVLINCPAFTMEIIKEKYNKRTENYQK